MATDLSLDLVAFVRSSVAEHLVNHLDSGDPRTFEIVARLCRDHNAEVKITTIEHCVMPLWQFLPSKRDSLLKLAAEMLEHPAVRDRAHGLIGASGTFDYQRDWSDKDISTWVEALATPLLRYGLEHFDHFSRLIGQVWHYYENFHTSNREDISEALDIYTASDFDSLNETAWLIPKIAANSDSTTKEIDHALAIFSRAPVFSKASVEYRLAKDLHLVRHNIFKQLIERPFHIESPEEFVSERAAIILGLLNSDSGNHEIILNIFENQRGILLEEKLVNYVNSQSDLLKMQLVLQAYGYDQASHVGARDAKLFHHKLIVMLVRYFVSQKPVSSYGRLIAAAVMCNEDHHSEEDKERWQSFVRLFLSSEDESFLQDFSLMLFAFNI